MKNSWVICCLNKEEPLGFRVFSRFVEGTPQFVGFLVKTFEGDEDQKTITPFISLSKKLAEDKLLIIKELLPNEKLCVAPLSEIITEARSWRQ